jgi:uncharacterized protein (TIGR02421 family)
MSQNATHNDIQKVAELDRELVAIMRGFLILGPLSWSVEVQREFLAGAAKNRLELPIITYAKIDYSTQIAALKNYIKKLGSDAHPAISFLRKNAESYLDAYYILQGAGTPAVSEFSKKLYGSPSDVLVGYNRKNISIAKYFLRVIKDFNIQNDKAEKQYTAAQFRDLMQAEVEKNIDINIDPINISVDANVNARAAAGPDYVKLREGATFTDSDLEQLLNHEVMTHTLTYINGRNQPVLSCLGYSAPRVTAIQEGLATFSEYINFSIDLVRLRRIALRIIALQKAEQGADFIDIFRFFRKAGQNDEESYLSAMRIFRGGVAEGGVVFYKDNVYLKGLIEVEAFLKRAMHNGRLRDTDLLFSGKLTTEDVENFHQLNDAENYISLPKYLPRWMQKREALAAHLAFNDLTERFKKKV